MDKNELRKEILQLIYDKGYRYIARNIDGNGYVHIEKPRKGERFWLSRDVSIRLFFLDKVFKDITFEDDEPLDIAKELGIIDWSRIPKDTKVLVSDNGKTWVRRYFAEFDGERTHKFVVYMHGKSSWTSERDDYRPGYKYCKLAEGE